MGSLMNSEGDFDMETQLPAAVHNAAPRAYREPVYIFACRGPLPAGTRFIGHADPTVYYCAPGIYSSILRDAARFSCFDFAEEARRHLSQHRMGGHPSQYPETPTLVFDGTPAASLDRRAEI